MTSQEAWQVARRVLGTYFIVMGLLSAPNALAMMGIVVPEGSSRVGYISAALLQAIVGVTAGLVLLRTDIHSTGSASVALDLGRVKRGALQLLGVFFVVQGADSFARAVAGALTISAGWYFRSAEFASASVQLAAGFFLIVRPRDVATLLERHDDA